MYLNHLSLGTGRQIRSDSHDIPDSVMSNLKPWLLGAIENPDPSPVPVPDYLAPGGYLVKPSVVKGFFMCTIFTSTEPVMTFGVASRSRHGPPLWSMMTEMYGVKSGIVAPGVPWCAHKMYGDTVEFTGPLWEIERGLAWAWIQKNK